MPDKALFSTSIFFYFSDTHSYLELPYWTLLPHDVLRIFKITGKAFGKICIHLYYNTRGTFKQRSVKDSSNDAYAMALCFLFYDFFYKSICCGYSFELHRQVDAIQMGTHNICRLKKWTKVNLKTIELLECALIGACAVIGSNTVC